MSVLGQAGRWTRISHPGARERNAALGTKPRTHVHTAVPRLRHRRGPSLLERSCRVSCASLTSRRSGGARRLWSVMVTGSPLARGSTALSRQRCGRTHGSHLCCPHMHKQKKFHEWSQTNPGVARVSPMREAEGPCRSHFVQPHTPFACSSRRPRLAVRDPSVLTKDSLGGARPARPPAPSRNVLYASSAVRPLTSTALRFRAYSAPLDFSTPRAHLSEKRGT